MNLEQLEKAFEIPNPRITTIEIAAKRFNQNNSDNFHPFNSCPECDRFDHYKNKINYDSGTRNVTITFPITCYACSYVYPLNTPVQMVKA
jgi:hypothetical protein